MTIIESLGYLMLGAIVVAAVYFIKFFIKNYRLIDMTPEQTLEAYLKAWQKRDFKKMHSFTTRTWQKTHTWKFFEQMEVISDYKILHTVDGGGPVIVDIVFRIESEDIMNGYQFVARLIKEIQPHKTSGAGTWGINPPSTLRRAK